ncbi:MAG: 3-hydroxyacyl-CoA dehydrogenase NAD-binding domain-containing protein [Candidatus Margulisiibacteriota bacterium]
MSAWHYVVTEDIGTLTFNLEGEKVNKLTSPTMAELSEKLTQIAQTPPKVLVIKSGKPDLFIAGADIAEIKDITTAAEGKEKALSGQAILTQLAELPCTTIAAIHGACLGGGFELALACSLRIVSDSPKTVVGLPEVGLGIIPGFGGTQRLPRLIGLKNSYDVILSGKLFKTDKALKLKMADFGVNAAFFEQGINKIAKQATDPVWLRAHLQKRSRRSIVDIVLDRSFIGSRLVKALVTRQLNKTTKGHYPAPYQALRAAFWGYRRSLKAGLLKEANLFSELVPTPISKNLIQLFFTQEKLKKETGITEPYTPRAFHHAGVLGAGLMGGGIAWLLSNGGLSVRLKDLKWEAITKGFQAIQAVVKKGLQIRKVKPYEANMLLDRVSGTTTYAGFQRADIVIEAVLENMAIKKQVFAELESEVSDSTIIASNTSSLSITEMATALKNPERFVGMHFFSPVHKMPLVEVIPGDKTAPQTIAATMDLARTLKKVPIVVQNCPGFLVNRILIPYVNEAIRCLEDGGNLEQIDRVAERFGMPLGPLALADEVGLDIGYKVAKLLEEAYGDRMQLSSAFEAIHSHAEWLGKKTGLGFYQHNKKSKTPNFALLATIPKSHKTLSDEDIQDRLILVMVNEAARCIKEVVVASPAYLDMAMIMGCGFPPFRGGLLRYADQLGLKTCVEKLDHLAAQFGDRFKPSEFLIQKSLQNTNFYP